MENEQEEAKDTSKTGPGQSCSECRLNSVTPFSKYFAAILFISLPFLGFWLGINSGGVTDCVGEHLKSVDVSVVDQDKFTVDDILPPHYRGQCEASGGEYSPCPPCSEGASCGICNEWCTCATGYSFNHNEGCIVDSSVMSSNSVQSCDEMSEKAKRDGEVCSVIDNSIFIEGVVREGGREDCVVDGVCSIMVDDYEVIWAEGDRESPVGSVENDISVSDLVEVFGEEVNETTVTLYGDDSYFVRKQVDDVVVENDGVPVTVMQIEENQDVYLGKIREYLKENEGKIIPNKDPDSYVIKSVSEDWYTYGGPFGMSVGLFIQFN